MAGERPVALVTGASSGIGRGLALRLALDGYAVGLLARRAGHLREVAAEIGERGGIASVHRCDVSERAQVLHAVEDCSARLGPVDVLVANAGMGSHMPVDELNGDDVELVMRVNFLGAVHAVEALLPAMLARGSGQLVAVASLAGYCGLPRRPAYCASKAAMIGFFESLRLDLRHKGIAVTIVSPGFVRTAMTGGEGSVRPFMVELEPALDRIARAIRTRRRSLAFPWQIALPAAMARSLPPVLFDFVARRIRH
ncbi:MAG: SDR family NAD(P)-dependent oxidoreductase [Gemmatimonadetes bacterium]|nr:SDR family NAD(P)-dependent oxidoreductase [Gemmatimonadota bacterium]MCY3679107.1 SDR family NAD(P)-dependent oxidoreductase [Gemmatimonadota bacterium]MYA42424.1 SDR family NAD(P)-dependent oxidoreductase [Gemmatimonadota bacterium]MYE92799.1 SDR family NAD(P)-dependent oxidoreductase [Gemmatimonadota bacterium]MYJ10825.1 SDR family NAD(P)-dependent oxidoreductase [Gemmatimonadota bacterium]